MFRRKVPRRHLIMYLRVFREDSGEVFGQIVDVSPEGMKLIREAPFEQGSEARLTCVVPVEDGPDSRFAFSAQCLWTEPDTNPSFHVGGFKLTGLDAGGLDAIQQMISEIGFDY